MRVPINQRQSLSSRETRLAVIIPFDLELSARTRHYWIPFRESTERPDRPERNSAMAADMLNPYEPTTYSTESDRTLATRPAGTQLALLVVAMGFVAAYYTIQMQRIPSGRPIPLWPTLLVPFSLSLVSAVRPRYALLPPLTAILGLVTGSVVFAKYRGWAAAETPIALAIGIFISIPSWIVARRSQKKQVATERD